MGICVFIDAHLLEMQAASYRPRFESSTIAKPRPSTSTSFVHQPKAVNPTRVAAEELSYPADPAHRPGGDQACQQERREPRCALVHLGASRGPRPQAGAERWLRRTRRPAPEPPADAQERARRALRRSRRTHRPPLPRPSPEKTEPGFGGIGCFGACLVSGRSGSVPYLTRPPSASEDPRPGGMMAPIHAPLVEHKSTPRIRDPGAGGCSSSREPIRTHDRGAGGCPRPEANAVRKHLVAFAQAGQVTAERLRPASVGRPATRYRAVDATSGDHAHRALAHVLLMAVARLDAGQIEHAAFLAGHPRALEETLASLGFAPADVSSASQAAAGYKAIELRACAQPRECSPQGTRPRTTCPSRRCTAH